jgi:hypothetical protein
MVGIVQHDIAVTTDTTAAAEAFQAHASTGISKAAQTEARLKR